MHTRTFVPSIRLVVLVAAAFLVGAPTLRAGIYLRVEKVSGGVIEGESVEQFHPSWIQLDSCNFGIRNSSSFSAGGGLSAGKAEPMEFSATKSLDKASPLLFLACAQSTIHPRMIIEFTDDNVQSGGSRVYLRLTLTNVVVNGLTSSAGDARPSESIALGYERIQIDYFMMDSRGVYPTSATSTTSWNFVTNTK